MTEYLLFIDTETSGLPKKWNKPYDVQGNWPFAIQIAWLVYTNNGELVEERNFYIQHESICIEPLAQKIHGITKEFLTKNGVAKEEVLVLLAKHIETYQPLVIGHFLELDFHVLNAEYFRAGMQSPFMSRKHFCTMLGTKHLVRNPAHNYLRVDDLYVILFSQVLQHQHNALVDAKATGECFFKLRQRGDITESNIRSQPNLKEPILIKKKKNVSLFALIIVTLIFVIYLWMYE